MSELENLMKENADALRRMKAEEWEKRNFIFEYKTQIYAHRW